MVRLPAPGWVLYRVIPIMEVSSRSRNRTEVAFVKYQGVAQSHPAGHFHAEFPCAENLTIAENTKTRLVPRDCGYRLLAESRTVIGRDFATVNTGDFFHHRPPVTICLISNGGGAILRVDFGIADFLHAEAKFQETARGLTAPRGKPARVMKNNAAFFWKSDIKPSGGQCGFLRTRHPHWQSGMTVAPRHSTIISRRLLHGERGLPQNSRLLKFQ